MRIIVNPAAAVGRVGREWGRVAPILEELGVKAEVVFTERPWHAISLAEQAVRDGHELVVAVGGDGTVCQAASGLFRSGGGALGILPIGTGNDVARTLGIPLDVREAARVVLDGHRRQVDLIRIGDYLVLNAIGVGLLGDINTRAARIKRIRGIVAYLGTALVSLVKFESPPVGGLDHHRRLHPGPARGARRRPARRNPGAGDRAARPHPAAGGCDEGDARDDQRHRRAARALARAALRPAVADARRRRHCGARAALGPLRGHPEGDLGRGAEAGQCMRI